MKLIVATTDELLLVEDGKPTVIHSGAGAYYGITWHPTQVFVVCRNDKGDRKTTIEVFDHDLEHVKSVPANHLLNAHQAIYHGGRLYIANTDRNRVEMYTQALQRLKALEWTEEQYDLNHVNSVWIGEGGGKIYVCEHNGGTYAKGQDWEHRSVVRAFWLRDLEETEAHQIGRGIHNIYIEGQGMYVCSSLDSALIRRTPFGEEKIRFKGWHPRGLARGEGRWVVGLSPCLPRSERTEVGDAALAVLDDCLRQVDEIPLAGKKQVNEVRLWGEPDYAHREEIR